MKSTQIILYWRGHKNHQMKSDVILKGTLNHPCLIADIVERVHHECEAIEVIGKSDD